eukprot:353248-Chlamydomonas_euryale.AAC.10
MTVYSRVWDKLRMWRNEVIDETAVDDLQLLRGSDDASEYLGAKVHRLSSLDQLLPPCAHQL